ncbi:MAG: Lrp/AsnC family transcriptional regulator [Caldilineae bacterium]|nr:MAG: Lrp/AsnC family transcriptional regulator [Caldilineae bacterium]
MVTAIILMNVKRDRINEVAEELAELSGVSEVYSVAGRYDLAVIVRVRVNEELAELVTEKIRAVEDITYTETMIAFRAYSRHDLEGMFSIGLEG